MRGKQAILHYLTTHHTFSPAQVARESGLTVNCISTAARLLAEEGVLIVESKVWRSVTYRFATEAERRSGGPDGINTIFADCRKSDAMKRLREDVMRGNDYNPDLHPNDLCIRQRSRPYPGREELIRRNSFASVNENKYLTMILRAKK